LVLPSAIILWRRHVRSYFVKFWCLLNALVFSENFRALFIPSAVHNCSIDKR
jgi:hypothetical protein